MEKPRVQLSGEDGNVFAIIGRCRRALREAGYSATQISTFTEEITAAEDYDQALRTAMKWCETR
jgi:hypothetical protein